MASLLFFTPVLPGLTGQGTAMRAGVALEILAEKHQVTVVHVDMWSGEATIADRDWPRRLAAAYHFVPSPVAPDAAEQLRPKLAPGGYDGVYVYRLIAAPLALRVMGLLGRGPLPSALDLDDDECARTEQFLALRDRAGDAQQAARERAELHRQRGFAHLMVTRFDQCLLASVQDMGALASRFPDRQFRLLPNAVRVPNTPLAAQPVRDGSLLFVATLDYLPNEDAVHYFANEVLPLLLASGDRIEFRVVGIKPPKSFEILAGRSGVTVVGPVRQLAQEYRRARVAVVPLRAGSGTRIKILEAFGHGVPVVSTSVGAAGLEVRAGEQLLIADTAEEFAAACRRLMDEDGLAERLAANAFQWLSSAHSMDRARRVLHSLFAENAGSAAAQAEFQFQL